MVFQVRALPGGVRSSFCFLRSAARASSLSADLPARAHFRLVGRFFTICSAHSRPVYPVAPRSTMPKWRLGAILVSIYTTTGSKTALGYEIRSPVVSQRRKYEGKTERRALSGCLKWSSIFTKVNNYNRRSLLQTTSHFLGFHQHRALPSLACPVTYREADCPGRTAGSAADIMFFRADAHIGVTCRLVPRVQRASEPTQLPSQNDDFFDLTAPHLLPSSASSHIPSRQNDEAHKE